VEAEVDSTFVDGVRNGRRAARDTLYRNFHLRVFGYLLVLVGDRHAVWDLTHDVFEKAFEAAARFDGESAALAPWLMVIARNTALDHIRATRRTNVEEPHLIERRCEREPPEARPEWGDDEAVHHAIAGLPAQQRNVLLMHYRYDRNAGEIGRALDKSADAVRHIEQRALATVRGQVGRGQPTPPP
jgi:RNA polymerase sigma factor (sigma-70 family)